MASALYSEDLSCSICLTIFTDPVTLPCGHSFCRQCVTDILDTQNRCPMCWTAVPAGGTRLPTSHILKSLADKAKKAGRRDQESGPEKAQVAELCPEHEEKLKLFCVTDQQLACIICRDGEKHKRHTFKPVKEAAASLKKELETGMGMKSFCFDIHAIEEGAKIQREEITKTKEKSQQLMTQIRRQFEEMHQFLRRREDEIKNDLKHKEEDAVEKMSKRLNAMETALCESRELEQKARSILEISDSVRFLKRWTEGNSKMTPENAFKPRANELQVVNTDLSLGPYESHLQFFMWKEMLQVIQPRPEALFFESENIKVSRDRRDLMYCPIIIKSHRSNQLPSGRKRLEKCVVVHRSYSSQPYPAAYQSQAYRHEDTSKQYTSAFSSNTFTSGQYYWEVEVGRRDYWKVGVTNRNNNYLSYNGQMYVTSSEELTFTGRPQKIGIYLDCASTELSFYDAENMTHIHTMRECFMSMPVAAYFQYRFTKAADHDPFRMCYY